MDSLDKKFKHFFEDEEPALDELRLFVGGELSKSLDYSSRSIGLMSEYIDNLTTNPDWDNNEYFKEISKDIKKWLSVRIAYYLARCLIVNNRWKWEIGNNPDAHFYNTPVLVCGHEAFSPLEVAWETLNRRVTGGLKSFYNDAKEIGLNA